MRDYSAYIGLDVHKDTVAVAVALQKGGEPLYRGDIAHTTKALTKLLHRLTASYGEKIAFCYEAGPTGYGLYRWLIKRGFYCEVIAPSLIPRKPGDRIKTDRRDAISLSRLFRVGDQTAVWVPDHEQEAMRDLTRVREDMKGMETQAKHRLNSFLLRHSRRFSGRSKNTPAYFSWLEGLKFENPTSQIVFQEYVNAVLTAQARVTGIVEEMENALSSWALAPVVEALRALRGVDLVAAMTVMAELGDITRFTSPKQLMAFLGLVPSEDSSGLKQRRGGITKTGNGHVRRVLIESAWSYRYPARMTRHLRKKAENASPEVKTIAWQAQKRMCGRYWYLMGKGKCQQQVVTAIARELIGFIWAIAKEMQPKAITA
ncbi:MAG: IS110 family transposase [Candidatus Marinimicrobia bacterium]|mgnify:CR=1 FL=1|nr:IS110 family transposase [Candidatus Neomarinimicrobiota bacterium]